MGKGLARGPLEWRVDTRARVVGGVVGVVVGDAVGLPYEFSSLEDMKRNPASDMVGGGTWGKPRGTWSDDGALTLATADVLASRGLDYRALAEAFLAWWTRGEYTADGEVFNVGLTTRRALAKLAAGGDPLGAGVNRASCGSLMRIMPVSLYTMCRPLPEALEAAHAASRLTHSHPLAEMACGLYTVAVRALLAGGSPRDAVEEAWLALNEYYRGMERYRPYVSGYSYLSSPDALARLEPGRGVEGSCYVPETLKAALWALLRASSYRETVLAAVNLGGDTDTVAAVAGGLAGVYYGVEGIPREWIESLARPGYVLGVAERLASAVKRECQAARPR